MLWRPTTRHCAGSLDDVAHAVHIPCDSKRVTSPALSHGSDIRFRCRISSLIRSPGSHGSPALHILTVTHAHGSQPSTIDPSREAGAELQKRASQKQGTTSAGGPVETSAVPKPSPHGKSPQSLTSATSNSSLLETRHHVNTIYFALCPIISPTTLAAARTMRSCSQAWIFSSSSGSVSPA